MSTLDYLASLCLVADLFSLRAEKLYKNFRRQIDARSLFAKSPNPLQNLVTIELHGFMVRLRVKGDFPVVVTRVIVNEL